MISQPFLVILTGGLFVMIIVLLAAIFFLIFVALEVRKVVAGAKDFLKAAEEKMTPALVEAEQALKNIKRISDDVATVSGEARNLSSALSDIVTNVNALSLLVTEVREGLSLRVLGLKAGVGTAVDVFMKQIKHRR